MRKGNISIFHLVLLAATSLLVGAIPTGLGNRQIRLIGDILFDKPTQAVLESVGGLFSKLSLTLTEVAPFVPAPGPLPGGPPVDPKPQSDIYLAQGELGEDASEFNPEDYDPKDIQHDGKPVVGRQPESVALFPIRGFRNFAGKTYSEAFKALNPNFQSAHYLKWISNGYLYYSSMLGYLMQTQRHKMNVEHIYEINTVKTYGLRQKPTDVSTDAWNKLQTMLLATTDPSTNAFKFCVATVLNDVDNLMWLSARPNQLKGIISTKVDKDSAGIGNAKGPNLKTKWFKSSLYTAYIYVQYTEDKYKATATKLKECMFTNTHDHVLANHFYGESLKLLEAKLQFMRTSLANAEFLSNDMNMYDSF